MTSSTDFVNMDSNEYLIKTLLLHKAFRCGLSTCDLVEKIWTSHIMAAVYEAHRLLALAGEHSRSRLELASRRAIYYGQGNYRTVKGILKQRADSAPMDAEHSVLGKQTGWPF